MKTKQLPQEWKEVELGNKEFFEIIMGQSPPGNSYNENKKGVPFFQGKAEFTSKYPIIKKWTTKPSKIAEPNSILMSVRAPVGDVNLCDIKCCIGRGLTSIKPLAKVSLNYLYHFLKTNKNKIANLGAGSTFKAITSGQLKQVKIPLPPLQTQKKITAILEKAEKLKQKREQSDKLTDEYLKSVFNKMFLKKDFEEVELEKVTEIISGSTPSTIIKEYWNGKINWVTPAELIDGPNYYYYETKKKITKEGLKSCSSRLFPKETIILTTRAPIGKVAIAGIEMCSNQGFKNFIPSEKINSVYLYFWFLLKKDYLNSLGCGATFKEVSKKIVSKIKIPLPPLSIQKKFASIVEKVEKLKEKQKQSSGEINNLFNALMQKAFKGELV